MLRLTPREFIKLFDDRARSTDGARVSFASIAQLPLAIGAYLPTTASDILLGVRYARKLVQEHQLTYDDLLEIPNLIETAAIIREKKSHLSFLGQQSDGFRLYNLVIKSNKDRNEVWIATLHRIRNSEMTRKLKKARASNSVLRDFARDFEE